MTIEVSPWDLTEISLPTTRQRRNQISASFVEITSSSLRSWKKRKTSKRSVVEDRLPLLTLTTPHCVSVLVETAHQNKTTENTNVKDLSMTHPGAEESSILQFLSRPGSTTAFLPTTEDDDKKPGDPIVCIPALFDAQCNRMYAIQNGNTKLVCYSASSDSGTKVENSSTVSIDLEYPAQSLSLLHIPRTSTKGLSRCLAFGTCRDGSVFVGYFCSENLIPSLQIQYIKPKQKLSNNHAGTFAHLVMSCKSQLSVPSCSIGKRKAEASPPSDNDVMVQQIFQQAHGILVVSHRIQMASFWMGASGIEMEATSSRFLIESNETQIDFVEDTSISGVRTLGIVEENSAVVVSYIKGSSQELFCSTISLRSGRMIGKPILLPKKAGQLGLLGPALLAVLSHKSILLFDTIRGARVHEHPLPLAVSDNDGCALVSDAKRSRLAVVYMQENKYCIVFATVNAENGKSAQPLFRGSRLSLAAGLATHLTCPSAMTTCVTWRLSLHKKKANITISSPSEKAVQVFATALKQIRSQEKEKSIDFFLRITFAKALKMKDNILIRKPAIADNPHDATPSKLKNGMKVNGIHLSGKKRYDDSEAPNGQFFLEWEELPKLLESASQRLIESASSLVMEILLLPSTVVGNTNHKDAQIVLRYLVRSGKLSARSHLVSTNMTKTTFSRLFKSLEGSQSDKQKTYTPFYMSCDLLDYCPDVSERQMVAILHHAISRSTPKNVAEFFLSNKSICLRRQDLRHATRLVELECKSSRVATENDELLLLGPKVMLAGVALLTEKVLHYSTCNQALLRHAIVSYFDEIALRFLLRVLVYVSDSPVSFQLKQNDGALRNYFCWLTVICDCFGQNSLSSQEVQYIKKSLLQQLKVAGDIVTLQGALNDELAFLRGDKSALLSTKVVTLKSQRSLPPYQIERLVF